MLAGVQAGVSGGGSAFAPSNIALCKYWGKRCTELNLPVNSSLSVSLGPLGTRTEISAAARDTVFLNGEVLSADDPFAVRVFGYINLFRPYFGTMPLEIRTENSIPTAAGLASSASGFAALILALDAFAGWKLDRRQLSILARLGSGSAARSVYDGFVLWHAGSGSDGTDSYAERLPVEWPGFRVGILELSTAPKPVGSRDGMLRTVQTSRLYRSWPDQAADDLETLQRALRAHDFSALGRTAECNALAMHATMWAAWPPLMYLQPESIKHIHRVQALRAEGLDVYLTIDAGPNLKLLFLEESEAEVTTAFPGIRTVRPFAPAG
jgi:diphosphomevalonate decarboxylase